MKPLVSAKHILHEPRANRQWHFTQVGGVGSDTVRVQLVFTNNHPFGATERWVLVKSFTHHHYREVPWNPFSRGYSFLDFHVDCFLDHETYYCTVQFYRADEYTVFMDTVDARLLWAYISRDGNELSRFEREAEAIKKNRKGVLPPRAVNC
jgi:hypothetical protein